MKKFISVVLIFAVLAVLIKVGTDAVFRHFPLRYGGYIEQYSAEYGLYSCSPFRSPVGQGRGYRRQYRNEQA